MIDGLHGLVVLLRELLDEGGDQKRDVLLALAEGRDVDVHDVESIEEVLAESPLLDLGLEILVGGGDDAGVHLEGFLASHALELLVLEHAQDLYLYALADLADFVEEDASHVRELEATALSGHRTGERSLFVAEELALEQGLGEGGTVHLDEGLISAVGEVVQRIGNELLAYSALAGNEH